MSTSCVQKRGKCVCVRKYVSILAYVCVKVMEVRKDRSR